MTSSVPVLLVSTPNSSPRNTFRGFLSSSLFTFHSSFPFTTSVGGSSHPSPPNRHSARASIASIDGRPRQSSLLAPDVARVHSFIDSRRRRVPRTNHHRVSTAILRASHPSPSRAHPPALPSSVHRSIRSARSFAFSSIRDRSNRIEHALANHSNLSLRVDAATGSPPPSVAVVARVGVDPFIARRSVLTRSSSVVVRRLNPSSSSPHTNVERLDVEDGLGRSNRPAACDRSTERATRDGLVERSTPSVDRRACAAVSRHSRVALSRITHTPPVIHPSIV